MLSRLRWSLMLLALFAVGCGGEEKTATVTVTKTVTVETPAAAGAVPEQPSTNDDGAAEASFGAEQTYENVGEIEIDGDPVDATLEVRVSKLEANVAKPEYLKPEKGNKYVRIEVKITNVGNDAFTPSADFQAVTEEGDSATFQSLGRPGDLGPAAIRSGRTARGKLWAEIPKGSTIAEVIFAPFGGDVQRDLVWSRS